MSAITCKSCGKENNTNAKFCKSCGSLIVQVNNILITCRSCKNELKAGAKFCNKCGTPVVTQVVTPIINSEPVKVNNRKIAVKKAHIFSASLIALMLIFIFIAFLF